MPYRVVGNRVEVLKDGKWQTAPGGTHKSAKEAQAHFRALEANVEHKGGA